MAVYKRRICTRCAIETRDARILKTLPPCARCGAPTKYTPRWYVEVRLRAPNGRSRSYKKAVSVRKEDAQAEERRLLTERDKGAIMRANDTMFAAGAKEFRAWITEQAAQKKLAAGSVRSYRYRLSAHLEPHFDGCDLRHIDHEAADTYVQRRRADGVKPATINRELATLKRLLSIAVKRRLIGSNLLIGYELLPEENARDIHLSRDEIAALLDECRSEQHPAHLYPIVVLALHTGLRREGCLTLRWEEVDWPGLEIIKKVKGRAIVRIPMTGTLQAVLKDWRTRGGVDRATGWVFPSPRTGRAMLVTSRIGFATACKAIGRPEVHFHDLRHTFATLFLEQFPDQIETLRVIMGHTSSYMTRRYAHITDQARRRAMAAFDVGG